MNKSEFITLIEHPENLEKVHNQALKTIIGDFPYLQQAHVMLAKALYGQRHYEYEKQLKHTALLVPDREVLYSYIHDVKSDSSTPAVSVLPEVEIPVQSEELVEDKETTISEINTVQEKQEDANETLAPTSTIDSELTFFEWLQLNTRSTISAEPKEKEHNAEGLISEDIDEQSKDAKQETSISVEAEVKQTPTSNIHAFENILDRFIRENPSISRPKAEFYNPVNVAKQSVEEDEDLATETLANIYYKQGHYKKAIRTYEKLCLIYPHKMAYFASLIQKIKTENKD